MPFRRGVLSTVLLAAALFAARGAHAFEVWMTAVVPQAAPSPIPTPPASKKSAKAPARVAPAKAALSPAPIAGLFTGDSGIVELTSGPAFPTPAAAVKRDLIDRTFLRFGKGRPMPLTGAHQDGSVTKLDATYAGVGLATLGVSLVPQATLMDGATFEKYLAEIGAVEAIADRAKKRETKKPGKEVALKSAKTFAAAWDPRRLIRATDEGRTDPLGLPIEFILEENPLDVHAGATAHATLLLEGKPLANQSVRLLSEEKTPPLELRTTDAGKLEVPLAQKGRFLLAVTAFRRTQKGDRKKGDAYKGADWESLSTTLHFNVLAPAPPPPAPAPKRKPAKKA